MEDRFALTKHKTFHEFPSGQYNTIQILNFEINEAPDPEQEIFILIETKSGDTVSHNPKTDILTFEEFKNKFQSGKDQDCIQFDLGETLTFHTGIKDEKNVFHKFSSTHTNNIEYFRIDIGYLMDYFF